MVYILKDTSNATERLGEVLTSARILLEEIENWHISAERHPLAVQKTANVASQALDVALKFASQGVSDETYSRLDKMFLDVRTEVRHALFDDEVRPISERLRDLESDFCDLSVLVEAEERRSIVGNFQECDNAISKAKTLAPNRPNAETQQELQEVSRRSDSIQSLIETAKISAFRRATAACVIGAGVGIVPNFLTSSEVIAKMSPYIVIYLTAVVVVTLHTWIWTKSKTAMMRSRQSERATFAALGLGSVVAVLASLSSHTQNLSPFSLEPSGVLMQIALGLAAGAGLILATVRLIKYASKLERRTYGSDSQIVDGDAVPTHHA